MADPSAKHTILVVDDSPDSLQLLNALLKDEFRVRLASDGPQALKAAAQKPHPDAILLDIMMPDMDGYEVCARLKAEDATREIPVIFLTAKTEIEDAERGFDVGGADYITKPILPPVVIARVRTHVMLKVARDFIKSQRWI
jgi:putative two-component system response regulator